MAIRKLNPHAVLVPVAAHETKGIEQTDDTLAVRAPTTVCKPLGALPLNLKEAIVISFQHVGRYEGHGHLLANDGARFEVGYAIDEYRKFITAPQLPPAPGRKTVVGAVSGLSTIDLFILQGQSLTLILRDHGNRLKCFIRGGGQIEAEGDICNDLPTAPPR